RSGGARQGPCRRARGERRTTRGAEAICHGVETIDAGARGQPRARRAPAGVARGGQDPALEVEVRSRVEADLATRTNRLVQRDLAIGAAGEARQAVPLEEELPVDVV